MVADKVYNLLDSEESGMIFLPAVTTITRYRGTAPVQYLRSRIGEILAENVWLCGRLTKHDGRVVLKSVLDDGSPDKAISSCFEVMNDVQFSTDDTYEDLSAKFGRFSVKRGVDCIDVDEPLFRVVVVQSLAQKEFLLICSLSHVLGDGYTFYRLYAMLDEAELPCSLKFTRRDSFPEDLRQLIGNHSYKWSSHPYIPLALQFSTLCRSSSPPRLVSISNDWLNSEKQRYDDRKVTTKEKDVNFISSNDILTSWFLRTCGAPMGCLAANFRNRVAEVNDDLAGNYEALITLNRRTDFDYPEYIRSAVKKYRCNSCTTSPSYIWDLYGYFNIALSTNWAGLYHHIHLPRNDIKGHCEHVIHMPLLNKDDACWPHAMVIFRLDESRVGVLIGSETVDDLQLEAVGTVINSVLH